MGDDNVAEIVAVVRADTTNFDHGMRSADSTIQAGADKRKRVSKEEVEDLGRTERKLGDVKLGWMSLGSASVAAVGGFLLQSRVLQAQLSMTHTAISLLADDFARGLGIDQGTVGLNKMLLDAHKNLSTPADASGTLLNGAKAAPGTTAIESATEPFRALWSLLTGGGGYTKEFQAPTTRNIGPLLGPPAPTQVVGVTVNVTGAGSNSGGVIDAASLQRAIQAYFDEQRRKNPGGVFG